MRVTKLIHSQIETVRQVTTRLFIVSFVGLASLVLLADTSLADTLRVSLVVALQVCTGATMWRLFRPKQICTMPELIGMGLALGSFVSLLSSQILRVTPLNEVAWALPTISFAILIGIPRVRNRLTSSRIEKTAPFTFLAITTASLIALTYWWWWLWPVVPAPFALYLLITVRTRQEQQHKLTTVWKTLTKLNIPLIVLLPFGMVALAIWLREFNLTWWIFSNDQVFSESLSTSLTVWGPNENIQLAGEPINYHWFSLAWAGMTTQAGGIGPWTVITKVLPICSLFGATCLTWTCTKAISKSKLAPTISLIVLVLASNPLGFIPTRYFHSPTFFFSMIWLLGFTLILIEGINSRISGGEFLLGLMLAASLGGKVSSGAIAFCGFTLCLVASLVFIRDRRLTRFLLTSAIWLVLACLATYLMVYRSQTIGTGSRLTWGFAEIGSHSGIAYWDSLMILRIVAWSGVIAAITPAVAPIFILFLLPSTRRRAELYYFVGAIFSGLVFVSVFKNSGASQFYFFFAGIVVASIGIGWALGEGWDQLRTRVTKKQITIAIILGVGVSVLSSLLWNWTPSKFDQYRFSFSIKLLLQLLLWTTALVGSFRICRHKYSVTNKRPSHQIQVYVASLILISSSISFGVVQRYGMFRNLGHRVTIDSNDPNLITGSTGHIAALTWLREHSDQNDVVATNRFCIPGVEPCDSRWYLVSALSRRRMLIEARNFDANLIPISAEGEKIKYSKEFTEHPTRQGTVWLLEHNVSWIFVDYVAQDSGIRSWEPYGKTVFSNGVASIVQLRQTLPN